MGTADTPPSDPLHGVTLETMLRKLVNKYGWPGLAKRVAIKCFKSDPSISSSLTFLRRTPWARKQVEDQGAHAPALRDETAADDRPSAVPDPTVGAPAGS